jgi:hypothetical protein
MRKFQEGQNVDSTKAVNANLKNPIASIWYHAYELAHEDNMTHANKKKKRYRY